jgi:hypothetical protein
MVELKREHDDVKRKADDIYKSLRNKQFIFIGILEALERTSYKSNHGTFSIIYKDSFKIEDKKKFFNWYAEEYGPDALLAFATVHSATLNAFANEFVENSGDIGMEIPGLELNSSQPVPSMRKN